MTSEYYERIYISDKYNIPLEYVSIGSDKYYLLSDYIPKNPDIDNLKENIDKTRPYFRYWLIDLQRYIIEYFKEVNITNELLTSINNLLKTIGEDMINKDKFNDYYKYRENDISKWINKFLENYNDPIFINKIQTSYYTSLNNMPTIYDFNITYEMPLVINKEIVYTESIENKKVLKKRNLVIKDIKTDANLLNSKYIQHFINNLKPSWNLMLIPTDNFKTFTKVKCFVKIPSRKNEKNKLIINTPNSLWDNCRKILDKNLLVKHDNFNVYNTKYVIKIKGKIDQNSFYHYLMTNNLLFNFLVPIDSVKVLKSNQKSYLRFVSRSSTLSSIIITFDSDREYILIQYISYIQNFRDEFYFKILISSIYNYMNNIEEINNLYNKVFSSELKIDIRKVSVKNKLSSISCQKDNIPIILDYTDENLKSCKDPKNKRYGIIKKEEYENFAKSIGYDKDEFLLYCPYDEQKYLGMSYNEKNELYACCYKSETSIYVQNSINYKNTGKIQTTITSRILSGIKTLKPGEIGLLNKKINKYLENIFDNDTISFFRKSYEGDLLYLYMNMTNNISYDELYQFINENTHIISQNMIKDDNIDLVNRFEYLFILEKYKNINIYIISDKGIEVGNYDYFYLKPFTNNECIIIYKDYNEDGSYTFNSIGFSETKNINAGTKLKYIFSNEINKKLYKSLLLSNNIRLISNNSLLNRCDMDILFKNIANYQLIDSHGKTYGIVISKENKYFNISDDKFIFFDVSSNLNLPIYKYNVETTFSSNLLEKDEYSIFHRILETNIRYYYDYLESKYRFSFNYKYKDIDLYENIIGVFFELQILKNNQEDFDIIYGNNNSMLIYIPIHPNVLKSIRLETKKSIYKLQYSNEFDNVKNVFTENIDEIEKLLIINQIYNNFIKFIINISYNQNIDIFNYQNYIKLINFDFPIYHFYYNYDYVKLNKLIPKLFNIIDDKIHLNLPEPYYTHVKQYLNNPKLLINYKSFSDTNDLLRLIQINDSQYIDIYSKRKISKTILNLIEPYYFKFNNNIYLVQKIKDNSTAILDNMISAYLKLNINLGFNCKEGDNKDFDVLIKDNFINIIYYDYNMKYVESIDNLPTNKIYLFIDVKMDKKVENSKILKNINIDNNIFLLLPIYNEQ